MHRTPRAWSVDRSFVSSTKCRLCNHVSRHTVRSSQSLVAFPASPELYKDMSRLCLRKSARKKIYSDHIPTSQRTKKPGLIGLQEAIEEREQDQLGGCARTRGVNPVTPAYISPPPSSSLPVKTIPVRHSTTFYCIISNSIPLLALTVPARVCRCCCCQRVLCSLASSDNCRSLYLEVLCQNLRPMLPCQSESTLPVIKTPQHSSI